MGKVLKPVVFMNGDETTRETAAMVREIFSDFPTVDIDLGAESRLGTGDDCIREAADRLKEIGAGVKISTASNHPEIRAAKKKSVNIILRPLVGAYCTLRMTRAEGRYRKPVAVLRYLIGGFYSETSCELNEMGIGTLTQKVDFSSVGDMAKLAVDIAEEHKLELRASSKWTIAESERIFMERIKEVWDRMGVRYETSLTDIAIANIPAHDEGGWLHLFDNINGDTASDVADFHHGNHVMGSDIYCNDGKKTYVYAELPGGTAPDKMGTDLRGSNFFNPLSTILAFVSMFQRNNPGRKEWFDNIRRLSLEYLSRTPAVERGTEAMIDFIKTRA